MSQPWRYECPYCGTVMISRRTRLDGYRCKNGHVFSESARVDLKAEGATA